MGLKIHSLETLPSDVERDFFVYLLDYGWQGEPIADVLKKNLDEMAKHASQHNFVVISGIGELGHFNNDVLSYHHINGVDTGADAHENSDMSLLPAILVTKTNPHIFKQQVPEEGSCKPDNFRFILIPLKKICQSESDVVRVIQSLCTDIEAKKDLKDFCVQKELKPGIGRALLKSLILEPNVSGVGFSFNKFASFLKKD